MKYMVFIKKKATPLRHSLKVDYLISMFLILSILFWRDG